MSILSVAYKDLAQALYIGRDEQLIQQVKFAINSKYDLYTLDHVPDEAVSVQLVLLEFAGDIDLGLAQINDLLVRAKGIQIFVVLLEKNADFMLRASHLGVRGFIDAEQDIEHILSVMHMQERRREGKSGYVTSFFSLKGGVGKTALATNIAADIDRLTPNHCVLLDLNVPLGDSSLYLDMDETRMYTVTDFIHNLTRFDENLIYRSLNQHASGLFVLPLPSDIAELDTLNGQMIKSILQVLRKFFDHIVIDCASNFSDVMLACLDESDHIVMITESSLSSLRATNKALQVARRLGYNDETIKLIVNRHQNSSDEYVDQVIDAFKVAQVFYVENDFLLFNESLKNAILINDFSKDSHVNEQLNVIAKALHLNQGQETENDSVFKKNQSKYKKSSLLESIMRRIQQRFNKV
jgi:pilus assembly protein CpaE